MSEDNETAKIVNMIESELNKIAGKDGRITTEERDLIETILVEVHKYKGVLDNAISDNKIDQQERIRLFQGKLNMVQTAVSKIRQDLIVSTEEQAIINGLQQLIPKITEYEDQFLDK